MPDNSQTISEQDQQALDAVIGQVPVGAFVSKADKFMLSVQDAKDGFLVNTYEWGESREEVFIRGADGAALRDWLTARLPV